MFLKSSFTSLIVGVFVVYVLHTCWVMYGIVYTKPCDNPKGAGCITPFLAGNPKLQVRTSDPLQLLASAFFFPHYTVCACIISVSCLCLTAEYLHCTAAQCRGRSSPDPQRGDL